MQRPELEDLDRGERLNRYGFRVPDASFTEEFISDAAPFAVGYSRPDRPERPKASFGKVNDKDIYERWDPEQEGKDKDIEANSFLKRYASDMNVHRSQLT